MSKTLRTCACAAGAAALLVVVAGCGGSSKSSDTTTTTATGTAPTESSMAFADGVCSAFGTWQTSVTDAIASVKAKPSKSTVTAAIDQAQAATKTMATTVKGLSVPQTSAGAEAKSTLQTLYGQITNDLAVIKRTAQNVQSVGGLSQAASDITTTVKTMGQQVAAARDAFKNLPEGELKQAFQTTPSCTALKGTTTIGG
jgi:hypothetical protein